MDCNGFIAHRKSRPLNLHIVGLPSTLVKMGVSRSLLRRPSGIRRTQFTALEPNHSAAAVVGRTSGEWFIKLKFSKRGEQVEWLHCPAGMIHIG